MFWRLIRYRSRSSGPSNASRKTCRASGGIYRSLGSSVTGAPCTRASGGADSPGFAATVSSVVSCSVFIGAALAIIQAHGRARLCQRLPRDAARGLATVGDNAAHGFPVLFIFQRALADRRLFL